MENGDELTEEMCNLSMVNNNNNNNNGRRSDLFQVMKAVEAAEATIKQQMEENLRLRSELQNKIQELEDYLSAISFLSCRRMSSGRNRMVVNGPLCHQQILQLTKQLQWPLLQIMGACSLQHPHHHFLLPEREYDSRFNVSGHGLVPISEVHNADITLNPLNEAVIDTRDQEQEILMLRKHVADYSIKEAQIHSEKFALEKRIAYMRLAFDQQQKDLVDAESKALSYRQDIIEENIRLTYALQDAEEERSTFVSSLMPLLAEYSLQPPVVDAQSFVYPHIE